MRAIRDLSSGVSGAREANVQLMRELESMSDLLGAASERQLALRNRVTLLEQSLERAHVEAQRERAYILDQQDAFISAMMDDHEQVIADLNRELDAARHRSSQRPLIADLSSRLGDDSGVQSELEEAKQTVERLLAERDRARETLLKVQAQRDEAQAELVDLQRERSGRAATGVSSPNLRNAPTLPPPETARSGSSPHAAPVPVVVSKGPLDDLSLDDVEPQAFAAIRPRAPELAFSQRDMADRIAPPPEELRAAVHSPSSASMQRVQPPKRSFTPPGPPPSVPQPNSANGATSQPGASTPRPGGYSMTNSVAPEHVTDAPRISRAPRD
jgi:hypothetical protein